MKAINQYRLIIWDLDGTLYYQKPFRRRMAWILAKELGLKPSGWKQIRVILHYRRLRENWDSADTKGELENRQYEACGRHFGLSCTAVKEIIERWMHKEPLSQLKDFRDEEAEQWIRRLTGEGRMNVVYSDYPTGDKLEALGICVDRQFFSGDQEISCMKPNPKGIEYILHTMGVDAKEALMIGDRMEKDGKAAIDAGIDYLILSADPQKRTLQYQKMNSEAV